MPILLLLPAWRKKKGSSASGSDPNTEPAEGGSAHLPNEFAIILGVLAMQLIACLCLVFFWSKTLNNHRYPLEGTHHINF